MSWTMKDSKVNTGYIPSRFLNKRNIIEISLHFCLCLAVSIGIKFTIRRLAGYTPTVLAVDSGLNPNHDNTDMFILGCIQLIDMEIIYTMENSHRKVCGNAIAMVWLCIIIVTVIVLAA